MSHKKRFLQGIIYLMILIVLPSTPGCELINFNTKTKTIWYYECANVIIDGRIVVS